MKYGLIGEKLSHSFSKEIHASLAPYEYELCELSPSELESFLRGRDFCGINVTIPYKQKVIPYLDQISESAAAIGSVNTIINRDGRLIGENTDFLGMKLMIEHSGISLQGKKVLVLGSGGTSRTARAVAKALGATKILVLSRQGGTFNSSAISYDEAYRCHTDADIIINTTPVGMLPDISACPIDLMRFPSLSGVVDAVYNPLRTRLVLEAIKKGIPGTGGLPMLIYQAAGAASLFLDAEIPHSRALELVRTTRRQKENIVLIGMPGCGKSTIGKLVAESLECPFIDTDLLVEKTSGRHPSDIIEKDGEAEFRRIETEAVLSAARFQGAVIATGGGTLTVPTSVDLLRQNGVLIFIDTKPCELPLSSDRPLSRSRESLCKLYSERYPLYSSAADATVKNDHSRPPSSVAKETVDAFFEVLS